MQGTLQSHNNNEEGSKKLTKTEPKQMCLQLLPKVGEGWNSSDGRWYKFLLWRTCYGPGLLRSNLGENRPNV